MYALPRRCHDIDDGAVNPAAVGGPRQTQDPTALLEIRERCRSPPTVCPALLRTTVLKSGICSDFMVFDTGNSLFDYYLILE